MREYKSIELWKDVSEEDWSDWKWQLRNRITSTEQLSKIIKLSDTEISDINECLKKFRMAITPYYATLIDQDNPNCPIRSQAIPSIKELDFCPFDMSDPLNEDMFSPVANIVHRYPDRVLFLLTHKCAMYCRHCTRRRMVGEEDYSIGSKALDQALKYIKDNSFIRDVLLSGGDPLILSDSFLEKVISRLREIPHVEIIRIGTRVPVVLPMRINDDLLKMLKKYQPIWINTHFNHPDEITDHSIKACGKIVDAGIPLGNQNVLLRGVNDNSATLKELYLKLVKMRVRPYYMYQCDLAIGISHFRTPVDTGINIMRDLRGYISGYAIPSFVIDAPEGGGKIPVNPEYVISIDKTQVIMKNYKGEIYKYPNTI
ncbi:MAG TPA: lysine 2,3-aminomutase [Clostridiaceae bacterium]|nr:lysine 2,3-aminomutase [Clostridiaceae bacterium]